MPDVVYQTRGNIVYICAQFVWCSLRGDKMCCEQLHILSLLGDNVCKVRQNVPLRVHILSSATKCAVTRCLNDMKCSVMIWRSCARTSGRSNWRCVVLLSIKPKITYRRLSHVNDTSGFSFAFFSFIFYLIMSPIKYIECC